MRPNSGLFRSPGSLKKAAQPRQRAGPRPSAQPLLSGAVLATLAFPLSPAVAAYLAAVLLLRQLLQTGAYARYAPLARAWARRQLRLSRRPLVIASALAALSLLLTLALWPFLA